MNITIIQYILLDFISKSILEVIDCRTKDGQARFIELYGIKKFNAKARVFGTEIMLDQFQENMVLSKNLIQPLFKNLNERSKRLIAAFITLSITTRNKIKLAKFLEIDPKTVAKGIKELLSSNVIAKGKIRKEGGGRKSMKQIYPDLDKILEDLVTDHVAGDPMTHRRWVRHSLSFFEKELNLQNVKISASSIRKYFKKLTFHLKKT
jgi:predicted transcriptional regulator